MSEISSFDRLWANGTWNLRHLFRPLLSYALTNTYISCPPASKTTTRLARNTYIHIVSLLPKKLPTQPQKMA